jgi:hypothetical protein
MIPAACSCPCCGSDQTRLGPRGAYPDQPHVRMAECQGCGKDFDVRVTPAGVEPAPVIYHGPPNHRSREEPMPAYPDGDTLVLRRPDSRSPAEVVALARRELAPGRRPLAPSLADVGRSPAERRLASFGERYPGPFVRAHAGVWWAVALGYGASGGCAWNTARAYAKERRLPAPRVEEVGLLALGPPCPSCQAALGWRPPRPKPKPRPAAHSSGGTTRTRAARGSTATRQAGIANPGTVHRSRNSAHIRKPRVAMVADARARLDPATAAYNAAACRRMGVDPAHYPHLTGDR